MGLELLGELKTRFGFSNFRPGQAEAIENLLDGRHALVVMPTGAGKSLVYQFFAVHSLKPVLVISPLISLMLDQVDSLQKKSIPATCINSAIPAHEQERRLQEMAEGCYRLIYIAPERLHNRKFQDALSRVSIGLLAVDEAHCISQWGHDFRPDYLHIAMARERMGNPVTVALTATATSQVQNDITKQLGIPSAERIVTGFNRPNLHFGVHYASDQVGKLRVLKGLLSKIDGGGAIVYAGTRRDTEEVTEFIREVVGIKADCYHAGLDTETRTRVQESFLSGGLPVVVATNAFGMGIDRADVRLVAHFSIPGTLESYYQEAGRAGRDGQPASTALIYSPKDRALHEWFIESGTTTIEELNTLYRSLQAKGDSEVWVTIEELSISTDLPEVKVKVGLEQLEQAGAVHRQGDEKLRMLIRIGRWQDLAVRFVLDSAKRRNRGKLTQLADMVAYAETDVCRRRMLLDHFGDTGSSDAPVCCDNCNSPQLTTERTTNGDISSLTEAEMTALYILDAIRRNERCIGRGKLAKLLNGSRAKDMRQYGYDKNRHYGRLASYTQDETVGMIDQLVEMRYIRAEGGSLPVLYITKTGEHAVKDRAGIPLEIPSRVISAASHHVKVKREAGETVELTARMFAEGMTPEAIAVERELSIITIERHISQLVGEGRIPLSTIVPDEAVALIREAVTKIGDVSRLAPIKEVLPDTVSYYHIRCVVEDRKRDGVCLPTEKIETSEAGDKVKDFLNRTHPRPLVGPWDVGWSLGFHSGFSGADWNRSKIGELVYKLKYEGERSAAIPLVWHIMALCEKYPELKDVDAIVPVPPTMRRDFDPVTTVANALSENIGVPVRSVVVRKKVRRPQKELNTLAQKKANIAGAFGVKGDIRGLRVLVLDDLFDSGATLEEMSRILKDAGASRIAVMTLSRTIHAEG